MNKISKTNIRGQYNSYRVLRGIWLNHGISRIELCSKLHLDKATISTLVSGLLRQGIVEETPAVVFAVKLGRKPIGLGVRRDFGFVVGFEYHGDGIKAVIKDTHFHTIETFHLLQRVKAPQIKSSFLLLYNEVKKFMKDRPILGIGVSIPGIVDHQQGVIKNSWELGIIEKPYDFQGEILDALNIPGIVNNDANCGAWGVFTQYRSKEYSNFLYVLFNYSPRHKEFEIENHHLSMGLGMVIDGKPYCGPDFTAGEFQTMTYNKNRLNQFSMNREEQARYENDPKIQNRVYGEAAKHLALLVNVFNFQQVFLGGAIPPLVENPAAILKKAVNRNWPYAGEVNCAVHIHNSANMAASSGAAGMFLEQLFSIPELDHDRGALIWQKVFGTQDSQPSSPRRGPQDRSLGD